MLTRLLPFVCAALLAPNLPAVGFRTALSEQTVDLRDIAGASDDVEAPRTLEEATGGVFTSLIPVGADHAYVRVAINRAGTLTGALFVEGQRISLSSTDDGAGNFDLGDLGEVPDLDDPTLTRTIEMTLARETPADPESEDEFNPRKLVGTLTVGDLPEVSFSLRRKTEKTEAQGPYSLIFPVPQFDARRPLTLGGTGYALMIVSTNGYVRIFGELATGQAFSAGAFAQDSRGTTPPEGETEAPPAVTIEMLSTLRPSDPTGTISGTLRFVAGDKNSDLNSFFRWRFRGREEAGNFRPGLRLFQPVLGSAFKVLDSSDAPIHTLDKGPENVRVKLSGFGLTDAITDVGNNRTGTIDSRAFDLDIHFDPGTGIYEGTCRHPASDRLVRTRGIVYQKTNEVFGLFLHGPGSGTVQVFGK